MRIRTILALGCAGNLLLIAGIVFQGSRPRATLEPVPSAKVAPPVGPLAERPQPVASVPPAQPAQAPGPPFRWSDLEADDYLQLATNLLGAGCPTATARDIVIARAQDDYAEVLWDLQRTLQPQFWDHVARCGNLNELPIPDELEKRIDEVSQERDDVMAGLNRVLVAPVAPPRLEGGELWSHLSAGQRDQILRIQQWQVRAIEQIDGQVADVADVSARRKAVRELKLAVRAKMREQIGLVVDEAGLREMNLRAGKPAARLRDIVGLDVSADEMRELAAALDAVGKDVVVPAADDPESTALRRERLAERGRLEAAAVTNVLGAVRAGDLARSGDDEYQTMRKVAWRHGLPMDVADRAFTVKQTAVEHARELTALTKVDEERRAQAAALLLQSVRAELSGIYGVEAYPSLEKYGMDWFDGLFDVKPPEAAANQPAAQ